MGGLVAVAAVGVLAVLLATYGVQALQGGDQPSAAARSQAPGASPTRDPREPLTLDSIQRDPHLVFQNVIRGDEYAHVSLVPLEAPGGARLGTDLVCERFHMAGGVGICVVGEHEEESNYHAVVFDDRFEPRGRIALGGAPVFAQVSRDGRYAALSVQTRPPTAEAPLAPRQTLLVDMAAGRVLADLASFALIRDGVALDATDVDVWGATFQGDSERFFASVRTAGNTYLVEGDIETERMEVRAPNVSSPALSPDGTRLAYARLVSNIGPTWRFHVMDLATGTETALAETKSIDEQPEWLDDETLLYGLATDIWSVAADGSGTAQPFLFDGLSPAVIR